MVLLAGLGLLVTTGMVGASLVLPGAGIALPEAWPAGFLIGLGSLVAVGVGLFYTFVLYVRTRAWDGERSWIWGLVALSVAGIASSGPLSAIVGVLTIVGAVQALSGTPRTA